MRRREFIAGLGGAAAWPLVARAQQPERMRRIGVLVGSGEIDPAGQSRFAIFRGALAKLGWTEGSNLQTELRWGGADPALYARYAAELVMPGMPDVRAWSIATESSRPQVWCCPVCPKSGSKFSATRWAVAGWY